MVELINTLDLREKIKNKEYGVYNISVEDEEVLNKQIDKFHNENFFEDNNITYCIQCYKDRITIILYKPIIY